MIPLYLWLCSKVNWLFFTGLEYIEDLCVSNWQLTGQLVGEWFREWSRVGLTIRLLLFSHPCSWTQRCQDSENIFQSEFLSFGVFWWTIFKWSYLLQLLSNLNEQYLIWKLTFCTFILCKKAKNDHGYLCTQIMWWVTYMEIPHVINIKPISRSFSRKLGLKDFKPDILKNTFIRNFSFEALWAMSELYVNTNFKTFNDNLTTFWAYFPKFVHKNCHYRNVLKTSRSLRKLIFVLEKLMDT